jgi:hypothetical protein
MCATNSTLSTLATIGALSVVLSIVGTGSTTSAQENVQSAPASAQSPLNDVIRENANRAQGKEAFIRVIEPGSWLSESLKGKEVVTVEGDAAGTVSDVLIGPDGQIDGLVLSRGGLFGIGTATFAINVEFFELLPGATQGEADHTSQTYPSTAPAPTVTATTEQSPHSAESGAIKLGPDGLPQHLVVRLSLTELDGAPLLEGR